MKENLELYISPVVKLVGKIFARVLQIVYFAFFIAHKFFQGPYILRSKDRIYSVVLITHIIFLGPFILRPKNRIFYALRTVYLNCFDDS